MIEPCRPATRVAALPHDEGRADEVIALGGFVLLAGLCLVAFAAISRLPERPARPARATIVAVEFVVLRSGIHEHVDYRAADGRTGTSFFMPNEFSCHVGDTVDAEEVGINLRLRRGVCRRGPRSPWASSPATTRS